MPPRVFILHGFQGHPEYAWRPWLRDELQKKGFLVELPALPHPYFPKQKEWVQKISEVVGTADKECYFVGHSLGCIAILRYLEQLPARDCVGGVILVAGFGSSLGVPVLENFFSTPLDWKKVKSHSKNFIAIHSDNDPYVSSAYAEEFREKLGATIHIQKGMRHFSGDEGVVTLPLALEELLALQKKRKKIN